MSYFGEAFKKLRANSGLSQSELGKALGCSKSAVNMYERGEREPDFDTLIKISDYFGVSVAYLLTGESAGESVIKVDARSQSSPDAWILDAYASAPERVRDIVKLTLEPYRQEAESSDLKKA